MPIVRNDSLETLELPGLQHQTIAGHKQGVKTMEVWLQTVAPAPGRRCIAMLAKK
jgi:hypothetical protein